MTCLGLINFQIFIHAVEHGIEKYKMSKMGKTVEMMLLPVTLFCDHDKISIQYHFHFMFEEALQRVFARTNLLESAGGKAS